MFSSVMRFMCGHRLHGPTNSTSGTSPLMLEAIEHSVISTTRLGRRFSTYSVMAAVEPAKSAARRISSGHSGWASTSASGQASRISAMSCVVKRLCTSQWPAQAMMPTVVCAATLRARYSSGIRMTLSTPHSFAAHSTT